MDGTEGGWQMRFLTAGVPLVMLAEPSPLVGPGIFTSPFRGKHWALVSPFVVFDMFSTRVRAASSAHGITASRIIMVQTGDNNMPVTAS